MADDETIICSIEARRKRGGAPCTIDVGFIEGGPAHNVVLRTTDVGGIAPIVALLSAEQAAALGVGLIRSAEHAE